MRRVTRRELLKLLSGLPVIGVAAALLSPLLRFMKPTLGPWRIFTGPLGAQAEAQVIAKLSDLKPWDSREFVFIQRDIAYNAAGFQETRVPGILVRLPGDKLSCFSRICPHLGCTFKYEPDPAKVAEGYDYQPSGPVYACPCHFSVFEIETGKVLSGPAPRPPDQFQYEVKNGQIIVTRLVLRYA